MATNPAFAVTPRIGAVSIATADASYTAPTSVGTLITGAATGTRVAEIVVKVAAVGPPATAAIVRVFLYDGTTYWLFDEVTVAIATGSATVQTTRVSTTYNNLILPSASWSVRVTTSVAQVTHVTAFGADL
jgi:hypothetical protein